MKVEVVELSHDARAFHERMLSQAVLFRVPSSAYNEERLAGDVLDASREARSAGVIPYPVTATRFSWRSSDMDRAAFEAAALKNARWGTTPLQYEHSGYDETSVFTHDHDGTLVFSVHTIFWPKPGLRAEFYTTASDNGQDIVIVRPTKVTRELIAKREAQTALYMTEVMGGVSRFTFLLEALQSTGYSAKTLVGPSRQVSRATGEPRKQFEVVIRKRGDRFAPPCKTQFAELLRQAHMVRAHMRTNWRTGEKTIRVRNFERGGRGEVAKPTYRVLEDLS